MADEGADLPFVPQQGTEVSCLISRGSRRIDEVSMWFVDILCQYDCWEARRLVLEDDLSRVVNLLLMEPNLGIEKKKVWYVLILRESFPAGVTP